MKFLRIVLLVLLAPLVLILHDVLTAIYIRVFQPVRQDMLGFGIHAQFTGWAFMIALPACIFLGDLWWTDRRRYLLHAVLLVALVFWSLNAWDLPISRGHIG